MIVYVVMKKVKKEWFGQNWFLIEWVILWKIPENQMQAATVICASGVAFWMRMIRAHYSRCNSIRLDAKEAQELAMHNLVVGISQFINWGRLVIQKAEIDRVTHPPEVVLIEGSNEMEHPKGLKFPP